VAALIAAQREDHRIPHAASCRALGVSQSWFYKWRDGRPGPRAERRDRLKAEVARLFRVHEGKYGSPRVTADLRDAGWRVSQNTVAALMREQGLAARRKKKRKSTTRPGKGRWRAPDLVRRDFPACQLNRKWFGDGTQIVTDEGRLHLVSVLEVASRRVLGFTLGERHDAQLAYGALAMALTVRGGQVPGVIFHTDQGSEYTAQLFRTACQRLGVTQSMGRPGSALDKTWASYCTSWCCCGVNSSGELAALAFDQPGIGGVGQVEQRDVLVIGLVGGEQPGAAPGLDGGGVDAEPPGDLGEGEQPLGAEPVGVAGQVVAAA
jgi:putative transposase